jgi:hypothetical protein
MFTVGKKDVFGCGRVGEGPVDACGGSLDWSLQPPRISASDAANRMNGVRMDVRLATRGLAVQCRTVRAALNNRASEIVTYY